MPPGDCGLLAGGYDSQEISSNGRYVTFVTSVMMPSSSSPGALNGFNGIAVHDRKTGATECGPIDTNGRLQTEYANSYHPSISGDGRYVAFMSDFSLIVPDDTNGRSDVFVRDRGLDLAVDRLVSSGKLSIAGSPTFASTGSAVAVDVTADTRRELVDQGADLTSVSLTYRPGLADLFVRLELERMPTFTDTNPAIVFGLGFTLGTVRYQVRAAKIGVDASFGLFREDNGTWTKLGTLRGGYGTTGEEIVFALPLSSLGLQTGGRMISVRSFTALGTYDTGSVEVLDEITIGGGAR